MYVPPDNMITGDYLKQILRNEKQLFKISDVRICNPPHYDEISVAQLYETWIKLPKMKDFFPDVYAKGRSCSRSYFFTIANTLHPEEMNKTLMKCKEVRFGADGEGQKEEIISMDPVW
jgi:hypothetical protein